VVSADAGRDERFPAGGFDVVTMIEFINDMAFALNEAMTASPPRRLLKRAINQTLSIDGIGDSLKVWAVKGNLGA
jgi:hypothetical protein